MSRVDRKLFKFLIFSLHIIGITGPLHKHLESNGIEYLQFAFRWMNNLLMREIPLRATIRLWDTYLVNYSSIFHFDESENFLRVSPTVSCSFITMYALRSYGRGLSNCKPKKISR